MQLMPFVKQLSVCASLRNNFKIHDFTFAVDHYQPSHIKETSLHDFIILKPQ